ncbi:MAG: aminotransferase class I/II-fold pyridoxal phosphate-dependent enzyme [Propionibacterium sp.]|nr:aminotransferase class I/II-fold pyridoxal phosphate-dependent enzyme [Propionibacterium sp.]
MKWRRYDPDVLPLWVAEMDVDLAEPVTEAMIAAIRNGDTGYPDGPRYEQAWAQYSARQWGYAPEVDQMVLAPDVMQSISVLVHALTMPGDLIVVTSPVYPPFYSVITEAGRRVLDVPLTEQGRLDLAALEEAFGGADTEKPTAFLLCSPHNPTATTHTRTELARVARLAREHQVRVIADEIHAPLVHSGDTFVPYLSVPGAETDFAVVSASKAWNLAAHKAALIVAGAEARKDLTGLAYGPTRGASSHGAVIAHTAALQYGQPWLDRLLTEIEANQHLLVRLLAEHLPQVRYQPGTATYLAWLDCRALGLESPSRHFLQQARVALNDGATFGPAYAGFARINLATSPEIITEAISRIAAAR